MCCLPLRRIACGSLSCLCLRRIACGSLRCLCLPHHLLLLTAVCLHLPLIRETLLLGGAAAFLLTAAGFLLFLFAARLLLQTDDLSAVGDALFGGAAKLFLHVAALTLVLGVFTARVSAFVAVGLFPLYIGSGTAGAVAAAVA